MSRLIPTLLFAASSLTAFGCGGGRVQSPLLAPDYELERTDASQAIVTVLEKYVAALEARDFAAVAELVSDDYYENAGTTDRTEDDYGSSGVTKLVESVSPYVKDLRVEVVVHDVAVQGERGQALFDYTLTMLYKVGDQERWQTARDVNRVEFRNEGGTWRILAGL